MTNIPFFLSDAEDSIIKVVVFVIALILWGGGALWSAMKKAGEQARQRQQQGFQPSQPYSQSGGTPVLPGTGYPADYPQQHATQPHQWAPLQPRPIVPQQQPARRTAPPPTPAARRQRRQRQQPAAAA